MARRGASSQGKPPTGIGFSFYFSGALSVLRNPHLSSHHATSDMTTHTPSLLHKQEQPFPQWPSGARNLLWHLSISMRSCVSVTRALCAAKYSRAAATSAAASRSAAVAEEDVAFWSGASAERRDEGGEGRAHVMDERHLAHGSYASFSSTEFPAAPTIHHLLQCPGLHEAACANGTGCAIPLVILASILFLAHPPRQGRRSGLKQAYRTG